MSNIHSYLQLGVRNEQAGDVGWVVWSWWCTALSPSTACAMHMWERVESGWTSPPNTCSFWFINMWRSLIFAHNFLPYLICCKNILSEMSAAGGLFCLPHPPTKSNCGNKAAPTSVGSSSVRRKWGQFPGTFISQQLPLLRIHEWNKTWQRTEVLSAVMSCWRPLEWYIHDLLLL